MFIYRDEYYNEDSEKKRDRRDHRDKQRNGSTGSVELVWLGHTLNLAIKREHHINFRVLFLTYTIG